MMVCDSGTRSNKVTSDSFYWGTCHWKMPFLVPEMQQVLAGILAAILWTYFQGGRMCFKKMKSDEIELLRSDWTGQNPYLSTKMRKIKSIAIARQILLR